MGATIINADVMDGLRQLPDESVHCVVTSPPYFGLRDYGAEGQIGLEPTPQAFVAKMVEVFREVRRVLRADGVCWVNMGDSYANDAKYGGSTGGKHVKALHGIDGPGRSKRITGLKPKDMIGIPWRLAFALQDDGWWLRSDIIWSKPNPMPESVTDRPTKSHEYVFMLTKSPTYFYDAEAIKEPAIYSGLANQDDSGFKDPRSFNGKHKEGYRSSGDLASRPTNRAAAFDDRARPPGTAPQKGLGKNEITGDRRKVGFNQRWDSAEADGTAPASRNKRSVWTVATAPFSEAHFATFPPDLIEPMILAGTSQHGCCAECGAPWERDTDAEFIPQQDVSREKGIRGAGNQKPLDASNHRQGFPRGTTRRETTGWSPSCNCNADVVPCTVLDPFSGAGTTALVADRLQRSAIGIELNPEYVAMSKRRIDDDRGGLLDLMEGPPTNTPNAKWV